MPTMITLSETVNPYTNITTALGSSFADLVTNSTAMMATILPIGITIFGMYMLIGFAKKIFTKLTGTKG